MRCRFPARVSRRAKVALACLMQSAFSCARVAAGRKIRKGKEMADIMRLHSSDNVVVALSDLPRGAEPPELPCPLRDPIPRGHKAAVREIAEGAQVLRYGQIIGAAKEPIAAGCHVHSHNLGMGEHSRDYAFSSEANPLPPVKRDGFLRRLYPGGRACRNEKLSWCLDFGELLGIRCEVHRRSCRARGFASGLSECRRCCAHRPRNGLRNVRPA